MLWVFFFLSFLSFFSFFPFFLSFLFPPVFWIPELQGIKESIHFFSKSLCWHSAVFLW